MDLLATAGSAARPGERIVFVIAGLFATWFVIDYFFGRIIGGNRAKHGGRGAPKRTSLAYPSSSPRSSSGSWLEPGTTKPPRGKNTWPLPLVGRPLLQAVARGPFDSWAGRRGEGRSDGANDRDHSACGEFVVGRRRLLPRSQLRAEKRRGGYEPAIGSHGRWRHVASHVVRNAVGLRDGS